MDSSDITLLRALTTHGSITRASASLFMSQPTLSKKLARLERQLEARLFHRSPTGLVPTPVTDYILRSAEPIEVQLKRIERHVSQLVQLDTGEVRLGVGPIIEQLLLPDVLTGFVNATGAGTKLLTVTDHADTLLAKLRNAELDLIAGPFRVRDHEDLLGERLLHDELVTVARARHPLFAKGGKRKAHEFPLAAPLPQGALQDEEREGRARKLIASDNYSLLTKLTLASDCVLRGPRSLFREQLRSGALREVGSRKVIWQSAVLMRPESAEIPLVKLLLKLLLDGRERYEQP